MIAAFLTFFVAISLAQPTAPPPRPPPFNPAMDAPHTMGQSGHLAPEPLPRSPHKQVLPPQAGPGIWAGDEPKAIEKPIFVLTEVPIYPSGQERIDAILRACGAGLEGAAFQANLTQRLLALSGDAHLCAVSSMMLQCAYMLLGTEKEKPRRDEVLLAKYEAAIQYLTPLVAVECQGGRAAAVKVLLDHWSAAFATWRRPKGSQ